MAKKLYVKFGLKPRDNGSFGLIAENEEQMRMLAELASISSDRISSFGPVTKDDTLTAILFVTSRKDRKAKNKRRSTGKGAGE